jgi:N-carbamoyl-L-amino-acid hydrolase
MSLPPSATPFGDAILSRADELARHSDVAPADVAPGTARPLTVVYLTAAHRACAADLVGWMREDGFDEAGIDAVGNVVGVYRGTDPDAKRLLTGSHYDTVRNAGRYDGRLGIFVPMACVRELVRQGRRLPFDLEVVGFAEEEGQRFPATFIGSGALVGHFDPAWLDLRDAEGVTLREAMRVAGHDPAAVAALKRDASRYLGFVEVHIEQGPVLATAGLPLGVVTAINGSVRFVGEMAGVACHAGTTPMGQRHDAATGVAELALYVERRAAQVPAIVGTVGQFHVPDGSINVVPGRCRFSLDLRAPSDELRDALVSDVLAELAAIATRRGLTYTLKETMRASAAPSDPALQRRWERAVQAAGAPLLRLPSGAGHDAMKLHEAMPQAMLFMRGDNDGISHNPREAINAPDTQLAVEAFLHFLVQLAEDPHP